MNRYMIKIVTVCLVLFLALQYIPANAQKTYTQMLVP